MAYKQVQYITTDKTAIITDLYSGQNVKIEAECKLDELFSNDNNNIFGVMADGYSSNQTIAINVHTGRNNWSWYCGGGYDDYAGAYSLNHRLKISLDGSYFIVEDYDAETGITKQVNRTISNPSSKPIGIGGIYVSSSEIQTGFTITWYEATVYSGETVIGHYVPYVDDTTGYGVLYDTVSGNYYEGVEPSKVIAGPLAYRFSISPESETIGVNAGFFSVELLSESPWTASTTDGWITLSQYTGSTDATIVVTVDYNPFAERVGTVEFTEGQYVLTLTVTQVANTTVPIMKIFRNGNRIN